MIDFELPPEIKAVQARVAAFIDDHALPAEAQVGKRPYFDIVKELQGVARSQGLWCPLMPTELGGMGLGPLANAVVQIELARTLSYLGPWAMNCMGPQDATMVTLLEHGTEEQHRKYLLPLINGDLRICFAMTEKAAGADATGMRTEAVQDGDDWVLNGEKWFNSSASISDIAMVMARTDPSAPRHRQFTTFLVELPNPGYRIVRDIPVMTEAMDVAFGGERGGGHAEVAIENLRVPAENIVGGLGNGFAMGQHRLGYGRLRHGMWSIAKAQFALDLATKFATERETFGERLADRQGIQWMLADCAEKLYVMRLMVLHIAYKMEHQLDLRQENSIAKNYIARSLFEILDTAMQIHGALGFTADTPLAGMWMDARANKVIDGPEEVHRWTIGRNVVRAMERDGTTRSAAAGDLV
jgi:acyl-CoA dehydrogenase